MKTKNVFFKMLATIVSVLVINVCYGNTVTDSISKVVTIKIPRNVQKVNRAEITTFSKENFRKPSIDTRLQNIYKIGNVLIGFEDFKRDSPMDLDELKDRILGEGERIILAGTNDKVSILNYNGIRFLIYKRHIDNDFFYQFVSEQRDNAGLRGSIQFKKTDMLKAIKILDRLFKSVAFK
jgi:hypothetical protein